jgi:PAS domain-containing protein
MNTDTVFTYVNPTFEILTGFLPGEWIGTKLEEHADKNNGWCHFGGHFRRSGRRKSLL